MLRHQKKPMLFLNKDDLVQWINEDGLRQPPAATGAPPPTPLYTRPDLPFSPYQETSYKKPSPPSATEPIYSVLDASRVLYQLNPELVMENGQSLFPQDLRKWQRSTGTPRWPEHVRFARTSIQLSAAFIAYSLLHASHRIRMLLPVRIQDKQSSDVHPLPQCLADSKEYRALVIGVSCSSDSKSCDNYDSSLFYTVLPLQLEMYGSARIRRATKYTKNDFSDRYNKFTSTNYTTITTTAITLLLIRFSQSSSGNLI